MPTSVFDKTGVLKSLPKFRLLMNPKSYRMAHPVYAKQDIETVKIYHHAPENSSDKLAFGLVKIMRGSFDLISRYNPAKMDERHWLNRIVFLETVAGVPGMIGGMIRHLRSLRTLERDHGWIHHLLQEAENERMHLFIFLTMRNPGIIMRISIAITQAIFFNFYFIMYMVAPQTSHRFVGYLEEEAVTTYTKCLNAIDEGKLPLWSNMKAPGEAIDYYNLDPNTASMRDVILSVRADEAVHRSVNHHFSDIPQFYDIQQQTVQMSQEGIPQITPIRLIGKPEEEGEPILSPDRPIPSNSAEPEKAK